MNSPANLTSVATTVYHDFSNFATLRAQARETPDLALHEVARQFEAIFLNMMLKAMRDATPSGGLFDSNQLQMYQEMSDQQTALEMSQGGGIGLARLIEAQLSGSRGTYGEKPVSTDHGEWKSPGFENHANQTNQLNGGLDFLRAAVLNRKS